MKRTKKNKFRNYLVIAMVEHHRGKTRIKDRRTPRGGCKDKQRAYLEDA